MVTWCLESSDDMVTVTKIKQERTLQDRTKIGPFLDFLLHVSIFLLEILNIVSQLIRPISIGLLA